MRPLRLEAPAKLNLWLAVTGRRDDGFHELASAFVLLELADRLLLMPGCSGLRVEGTDADALPLDDRNLASRGLRAGFALEPELACLALEKRIPVAAGLGGGSSDAAAAWRLGRRWRGAADPSDDEIAALAEIGADVPFFAAAVPAAIVTGVGERIESLDPGPARNVVLIHPPFRLSTAEVFAELRRDEWSGAAGGAGLKPGANDLLAPARRRRPEIADLERLAVAAGLEPHLTGSGPTLFAVTDDSERAHAAAGRLERAGVRSTVTRTRTAAASIKAIAESDEEEPE